MPARRRPDIARRWARLAFVCALMLVGPSQRAFATHPGVNGRVAFTNLIDKGTTSSRRAVFVSPGGQVSHPTHQAVVNGNTTTYFSDNDSDPAWSLDGKTLAFVRRHAQTNEYGIYTVSPDGGNLHLVAGHLDGLGNPTFLKGKTISNLVWSPDGLRIGFMLREALGPRRIMSVLAASGAVPSFSVHVSNFHSAVSVGGFDWTRAGIVYH